MRRRGGEAGRATWARRRSGAGGAVPAAPASTDGVGVV
jgi:hypothetical protein